MRAGFIALILTGLLASASANALVVFSSQYEIGAGVGANSGVSEGDIVTVEAFYDPLFATLQFEGDLVNVVHSFDAAHGGLRFTVGDLVWETTGPLTVNTRVLRDYEGDLYGATIIFSGDTNPVLPWGLPTTMSTPWDDQITGRVMMSFNPEFNLTDTTIDGPRLFDEQDLASSLSPRLAYNMGGALAVTSDGVRHFDFFDPAFNAPAGSVPEPGSLGLFALGASGLLFAKRKRR